MHDEQSDERKGERREGEREEVEKEIFGMCSPIPFSVFTSYVAGILTYWRQCPNANYADLSICKVAHAISNLGGDVDEVS